HRATITFLAFLSTPPICFFFSSATTVIYTLSLHDALPISSLCIASISSTVMSPEAGGVEPVWCSLCPDPVPVLDTAASVGHAARSEEHTSELQSRENLVCRLLLEKKNPTSIVPKRIVVTCS